MVETLKFDFLFQLLVSVPHWPMVWLVLVVYSISTTTCCFVVSAFCSKANIASISGMVMWSILYIPYYLTLNLSTVWKTLACLCPNSALTYAFDVIFYDFQDQNSKREWYEFWGLSGEIDKNLGIGKIIFVMLFSSVINFFIALYLEKIMPGQYDIPKKWNFPFKKEFWSAKSVIVDDNDKHNSETMHDFCDASDYIECPRNLHAVVNVKNLSRIFAKTKKSAVKDFTFKMYDDEITGKAINILCKPMTLFIILSIHFFF